MNSAIPLHPVPRAHRRIPNFDPLARVYRWMEYFTFGPWLHRCRCAFLEESVECRRALVFGDGDGRFTAKLLSTNPTIQIDAVDSSRAMLHALLGRAAGGVDRLRLSCSDARDWRPPGAPYDLVVTHFFLDCLRTEDVEALSQRVRGALFPSARWIVSEFFIPKGWFGWLIARPLIWLLYQAFALLTGLDVRRLPDYRSALRNSGFRLEKRRSVLKGLLVSELWSSVPIESIVVSQEP